MRVQRYGFYFEAARGVCKEKLTKILLYQNFFVILHCKLCTYAKSRIFAGHGLSGTERIEL